MKKATSFLVAASAIAMAASTVGCATSHDRRVMPVAANDNYAPQPPKAPTPVAANDNRSRGTTSAVTARASRQNIEGPMNRHGRGKVLSSNIELSATQREILPLIEQIAEENGIDAGEFAALVWIESRLNPLAKSPLSSASGLCQFISSTGKQYGLTDPFNARNNLTACAALWKNNGAYFEKRIGRKASGGMQYLMHQQGAGTAIKMVIAGEKLAKTVASRQAIALNLPGKNPDTVTAREFVEFWEAKFNRARVNFLYE